MIFVKRCLRIKDTAHPFNKRCKSNAMVNGVLCKSCLEEAKRGPIFMLMNSGVTELFKVPYKNQIYVKVDLSPKTVPQPKPKSSTDFNTKLKLIKGKLMEEMGKMSLTALRKLHDDVKLNIWDALKQQSKTDYAIQYTVSKEIISRFILSGVVLK